MLELPDLAAVVAELRDAGVHFRNGIVTGVGGKQLLLNDPSGNPVELFEPTLREASHTREITGHADATARCPAAQCRLRTAASDSLSAALAPQS